MQLVVSPANLTLSIPRFIRFSPLALPPSLLVQTAPSLARITVAASHWCLPSTLAFDQFSTQQVICIFNVWLHHVLSGGFHLSSPWPPRSSVGHFTSPVTFPATDPLPSPPQLCCSPPGLRFLWVAHTCSLLSLCRALMLWAPLPGMLLSSLVQVCVFLSPPVLAYMAPSWSSAWIGPFTPLPSLIFKLKKIFFFFPINFYGVK